MCHKIGQISFSQNPSFPCFERRNDMRQESQRIIRWKQRKTDEISKDDQHKQVIQVASFFLRGQNDLMKKQSINNLPDHSRRGFQFLGERRQECFKQIAYLLLGSGPADRQAIGQVIRVSFACPQKSRARRRMR